MGRTFQVIQGTTVEEQLTSIDGLLLALGRRTSKGESCIKVHNGIVPMCVFLTDSDNAKTLFPVGGIAKNILIDVDSCETGTDLIITVQKGSTVQSYAIPIKVGMQELEGKYVLQPKSKLTFSFSLPITSATIAFTFTPRGEKDETKTLPIQ